MTQQLIDIYSAIYHYYISQGFSFYKENLNASWSKYYFNTKSSIEQYRYKDTVELQDLNDLLQYAKYATSPIAFSTFLSSYSNSNNEEQIEKFILGSFANVLTHHPEHTEFVIQKAGELFPIKFKTHYKKLFDIALQQTHPNTLLKFVSKISTSAFSAFDLELNEFYTYFKNSGIDNHTLDKFLLSFLKKRKNQVCDPFISSTMRDSLISLYKDDVSKLEPYFSFFPALKKKVNKTETINIFKDKTKYISSFKVNVKDLETQACLDGFDYKNYIALIEIFLDAVSEHYATQEIVLHQSEEKTYNVRIILFHDNEKLNDKNLQNIFTELLNFLYDNPGYTCTKENILIWLQKCELENLLDRKTIKTHVNKI